MQLPLFFTPDDAENRQILQWASRCLQKEGPENIPQTITFVKHIQALCSQKVSEQMSFYLPMNWFQYEMCLALYQDAPQTVRAYYLPYLKKSHKELLEFYEEEKAFWESPEGLAAIKGNLRMPIPRPSLPPAEATC